MKDLEGALGTVLGYDTSNDAEAEAGMGAKMETTKID
jgi:hypothetical protein